MRDYLVATTIVFLFVFSLLITKSNKIFTYTFLPLRDFQIIQPISLLYIDI